MWWFTKALIINTSEGVNTKSACELFRTFLPPPQKSDPSRPSESTPVATFPLHAQSILILSVSSSQSIYYGQLYKAKSDLYNHVVYNFKLWFLQLVWYTHVFVSIVTCYCRNCILYQSIAYNIKASVYNIKAPLLWLLESFSKVITPLIKGVSLLFNEQW